MTVLPLPIWKTCPGPVMEAPKVYVSERLKASDLLLEGSHLGSAALLQQATSPAIVRVPLPYFMSERFPTVPFVRNEASGSESLSARPNCRTVACGK